MKKVFLVSLLFIGLMFQSDTHAKPLDVEFTILITSYKNEKWAKDNIKSACSQKSTNPYKVIVITDCSPDRTGEIIDTYVQKHKLGSFVTVIHNTKRVGALENIYNAIHNLIPDNHVVVSLDGDDLFPDDEVLLQLERRYQDPDIWLTYGSVLQIPAGHAWMSKHVPDSVFKEGKIRQYYPFVTQHLRTFKAALFKKVKKEDMMYEGKFMQVTWDMAFMFPMLEMATPKDPGSRNHHVFIDEILYLYRVNNPINDFRVHQEAQAKMDDYIRSKPPYEPIESLPINDVSIDNAEKPFVIKKTAMHKILPLYQLMKDFHELCEAHEIQYWADSGTLLGILRHKGIIPWDDDIDVCMHISGTEKLLSLTPLFSKLGYWMEKYHWGYKLRGHAGAALDVFMMEKLDNKYIYSDEAIREFYATRDGGPIYYTEEELFPLKKYAFGELFVSGPNNPYPYVDHYYKGWTHTARFLVDHVDNVYDSRMVILTDKDKLPAMPTGPLKNRVY